MLLLDENQISDLMALYGLTELVHLSVRDNRLQGASILNRLKSLQRVDLTGNRITDIVALSDLRQLVWVRLAGNPIMDFSPLARLMTLQWLTVEPCGSRTDDANQDHHERRPIVLFETANEKGEENLKEAVELSDQSTSGALNPKWLSRRRIKFRELVCTMLAWRCVEDASSLAFHRFRSIFVRSNGANSRDTP